MKDSSVESDDEEDFTVESLNMSEVPSEIVSTWSRVFSLSLIAYFDINYLNSLSLDLNNWVDECPKYVLKLNPF